MSVIVFIGLYKQWNRMIARLFARFVSSFRNRLKSRFYDFEMCFGKIEMIWSILFQGCGIFSGISIRVAFCIEIIAGGNEQKLNGELLLEHISFLLFWTECITFAYLRNSKLHALDCESVDQERAQGTLKVHKTHGCEFLCVCLSFSLSLCDQPHRKHVKCGFSSECNSDWAILRNKQHRAMRLLARFLLKALKCTHLWRRQPFLKRFFQRHFFSSEFDAQRCFFRISKARIENKHVLTLTTRQRGEREVFTLKLHVFVCSSRTLASWSFPAWYMFVSPRIR